MTLLCCLGKMGYDRGTERANGLLWERNFGQIIVPYGFSAQKTTPKGIDRMVWDAGGNVLHIQIRHKQPFEWGGIGRCYGYEKYRLGEDMKIVAKGGIALYVIHDYTRYGKDSDRNEISDWVAEEVKHLAVSVDLEREGPTWFGDYTRKQIKPICYWHVDKFQPLDQILEGLRNKLGGL